MPLLTFNQFRAKRMYPGTKEKLPRESQIRVGSPRALIKRMLSEAHTFAKTHTPSENDLGLDHVRISLADEMVFWQVLTWLKLSGLKPRSGFHEGHRLAIVTVSSYPVHCSFLTYLEFTVAKEQKAAYAIIGLVTENPHTGEWRLITSPESRGNFHFPPHEALSIWKKLQND